MSRPSATSTPPARATSSASTRPTTCRAGARAARTRPRAPARLRPRGRRGRLLRLAGGRVRNASGRLGLDVAGRATWDPAAGDYDRLAERVARSGAEAVFVAGLVVNNAGLVIRALRRQLGDAVDVLATDGVAPPALLKASAGRAARGVFISTSGVPVGGDAACGHGVRRPLRAHAAGRDDRAVRRLRRARDRRHARRDRPIRRHARLGGRRAVPHRVRQGPDRAGRLRRARGHGGQAAVTILRVTDGKARAPSRPSRAQRSSTSRA